MPGPKPWEDILAPKKEARRVALEVYREARGQTCGQCIYGEFSTNQSTGSCGLHSSPTGGGPLYLARPDAAACSSFQRKRGRPRKIRPLPDRLLTAIT